MTTPYDPYKAILTDAKVLAAESALMAVFIGSDCGTIDALGRAVHDATRAATVAEYEAKLAALEADKARLDWMEGVGVGDYHHLARSDFALAENAPPGYHATFREAIDAARTPSQEATNDR